MSKKVTEGATAIDRALRLLKSIADAQGGLSLSSHARQLSLSLPTAHRLASALQAHGLIARIGPGRYLAGIGLLDLADKINLGQVLATIARPLVRALAAELQATIHLGILEGDMVTYVVKEPTVSFVPTREGQQLEAYCSAIGKVILANLSEDKRERYLGTAPFVALTERTITTPEGLRACLIEARLRGHAVDDGEFADGLQCIAVPIRRRSGEIVGALSLSSEGGKVLAPMNLLRALTHVAGQIEAALT